MKRLFSGLVIISLSFGAGPAFANNYKYEEIGVPIKTHTGHTVTVDSLVILEKTDTFQLTVNYRQQNESATKKTEEKGFKLFFEDGTFERQSGFFGSLEPGETKASIWVVEWSKSKTPLLIEWEQFGQALLRPSSAVKWRITVGTSTPSPTSSPPSSEPTYQKFAVDSTSSTGLVVNLSQITFEPHVTSNRPQVIGLVNLYTPVTNRSISSGYFSLHLQKGSPILLRKDWGFKVRPKWNYPIGLVWNLKSGQVPLYIQWNPTTKILGPKSNALRWEVPRW